MYINFHLFLYFHRRPVDCFSLLLCDKKEQKDKQGEEGECHEAPAETRCIPASLVKVEILEKKTN